MTVFRGKGARDFETPPESLVNSSSFLNFDFIKRLGPGKPDISRQQETDNFDNSVESRK